MCARAFAARERADGLQELRVLEEEATAPRSDVHGATLKVNNIAVRADGIAQECVGRNVGALLAQDHNARLWIRKAHGAGVGGKVAAEDAQQRGLAAAVWAHESKAIAWDEFQVKVAEERSALKALGNTGGMHQAACSATAGGEVNACATGTGGGVAFGDRAEFFAAFRAVFNAALCLGAPCLRAATEPGVVDPHFVGKHGFGARLAF